MSIKKAKNVYNIVGKNMFSTQKKCIMERRKRNSAEKYGRIDKKTVKFNIFHGGVQWQKAD